MLLDFENYDGRRVYRKRIHFSERSSSGSLEDKPSKDQDGKASAAGGGGGMGADGSASKDRPKRPTSRRKKSIRIILDEDDEGNLKDTMKSETSMTSTLERKIRFEGSPCGSGPVTPLDSKGSAPSETTAFEDKVSPQWGEEEVR